MLAVYIVILVASSWYRAGQFNHFAASISLSFVGQVDFDAIAQAAGSPTLQEKASLKPLTSMPSISPAASNLAPLVCDGRYSDGHTAASWRARVTLTGSSIVIERGSGETPLVWPLTGLETAEPIDRSAIDVLIHEPGHGGATLFVPESAFSRELARRAPHLAAGAQRWRVARVWVWLTLALAAVAAFFAFTDVSPSRGIARLIPHKTRVIIGRQVINSMKGASPFCDAPAGKAALQALVTRLETANGGTTKFVVKVADSNVVNAFAAPGEQIVIMRGVLDKAESPDEVAGVLAHEMGHGLEMHPEAGIVRIMGLTALTEFILGGSGGTLANIGLLLTQNSYSRQAEREADAHALKTLKAAHVSPAGFAAFFRRVAKIYGEKTDQKSPADASEIAIDMLRTHPSTKERIAAIEALPPYPSTPAMTTAEWSALKSICGDKPAGHAPPPPRLKPSSPAPFPAPAPGPTPDRQRDI